MIILLDHQYRHQVQQYRHKRHLDSNRMDSIDFDQVNKPKEHYVIVLSLLSS